MDIEILLNWNAVWLLIWAMGILVGAALLFMSRSVDRVYRAMRIHGSAVFLFLVLTAITNYAIIAQTDYLRYNLIAIRAVAIPLAALSFFYMAYEVWKARQ